ncbi:MAG: nitroreductase family protein [Hyphomicrobiaceae bacterium]
MSSQKKTQHDPRRGHFHTTGHSPYETRPNPVRRYQDLSGSSGEGAQRGNAQPARFVVVNQRAKIEALGKLYLEAWWVKRREIQGWQNIEDIPPDDKIYRAATRFAEAFGEVPLVVLPVAPKGIAASSVFPWLQNMMLAARAISVGSVLTTLHPQVDARVARLFGIPEDVLIFGCVPMGYPCGRFGPTSRKSITELAFFNEWGVKTPWHVGSYRSMAKIRAAIDGDDRDTRAC